MDEDGFGFKVGRLLTFAAMVLLVFVDVVLLVVAAFFFFGALVFVAAVFGVDGAVDDLEVVDLLADGFSLSDFVFLAFVALGVVDLVFVAVFVFFLLVVGVADVSGVAVVVVIGTAFVIGGGFGNVGFEFVESTGATGEDAIYSLVSCELLLLLFNNCIDLRNKFETFEFVAVTVFVCSIEPLPGFKSL